MIEKLKKRLEKVEKELDTCRTSVLQDGWQTQRHARKARKWDILAQQKMNLIQQIEDYCEPSENCYACNRHALCNLFLIYQNNDN